MSRTSILRGIPIRGRMQRQRAERANERKPTFKQQATRSKRGAPQTKAELRADADAALAA